MAIILLYVGLPHVILSLEYMITHVVAHVPQRLQSGHLDSLVELPRDVVHQSGEQLRPFVLQFSTVFFSLLRLFFPRARRGKVEEVSHRLTDRPTDRPSNRPTD